MKEINPIVQKWVGNNLPREHIFVKPENLPNKTSDIARLYFRKWLVHPTKRHLTHYYSTFLSQTGTEIIGIAGSAGKTTTKELITAVLSQKFSVNFSPGNIDPVYNIPSTVLATKVVTQKLVLEMGIEFLGEMDYYLWLAKPKIGVLTNISLTHAEYLGSLDDIAVEKSKLIMALGKADKAILNSDDKKVAMLVGKTKAEVITFGMGAKADIKALDAKITKDLTTRFVLVVRNEQVLVDLPLLGKHLVPMALAAAAVGSVSGMDIDSIKKGLEKVKNQPHRMAAEKVRGMIIVDDSYNANPLATKASIDVLREIPTKGKRIFVFGDMKELGKYENKAHRDIGRILVGKTDLFYTLGNLAQLSAQEAIKAGMAKANIFSTNDKTEIIERLIKVANKGDTILVKGSRSMGMEKIVKKMHG